MTYSSIQEVELAVRTVLREQAGRQRPGSRGETIFAERLLSLGRAEALPEGIAELCVAPGTVVTPLARDFLKRRGIGLKVVARSDVDRVRELGEWGFAIENHSGLSSALRRTLLDDAAPWLELDSQPGLAQRWLAESPNRGALFVTDEASVAVWRSRLWPSVRAAAAHDVNGVERAVRHLGVNLLVVEPAGKSISLMKQMSRAFRQLGAPRMPEGLEREEGPCESPR